MGTQLEIKFRGVVDRKPERCWQCPFICRWWGVLACLLLCKTVEVDFEGRLSDCPLMTEAESYSKGITIKSRRVEKLT